MNKFRIFYDVPDGAKIRFSVADINGNVFYSANLNSESGSSSSWKSSEIKHPSEAVDQLSGDPYYGLILDLAFADSDEALGTVWVDDDTNPQSWKFKISSTGKNVHTINVSFLIA